MVEFGLLVEFGLMVDDKWPNCVLKMANVTFGHQNGRIGFEHGQCDFWSSKWPNLVWTDKRTTCVMP